MFEPIFELGKNVGMAILWIGGATIVAGIAGAAVKVLNYIIDAAVAKIKS